MIGISYPTAFGPTGVTRVSIDCPTNPAMSLSPLGKRGSTSPDSASTGSKPSMPKSARTPRSCPWADVSPCRQWHPAGSSRCFRRSQVAWRWPTMSPNRRIAILPPEDQGPANSTSADFSTHRLTDQHPPLVVVRGAGPSRPATSVMPCGRMRRACFRRRSCPMTTRRPRRIAPSAS